MSLFDDLFGGTDNTAQNKTAVQNANILQRTAELAERARDDAFRLFPGAQDALTNTANRAIDVNAQGADAQLNAFTQGNQDAQSIQARGLGAFNDAIMGNAQDFSPENLLQGVSARMSPDTSFLQQTAPQMASPQALGLTSDANYGGGFPQTAAAPSQGAASTAPRNSVGGNSPLAAIANQYLSGGLGEAEGTRQVIAKANEMGLDLGQVSNILGLAPADILRLSSENGATLNSTGDANRIASQTSANYDLSGVNVNGPDPFAPITQGIQSGDISLQKGTTDAINMDNQMGLSAAQLASQLGLAEADVKRLAAQFGLTI